MHCAFLAKGCCWSRFTVQFGGKAKMDSGFNDAASFMAVIQKMAVGARAK
jgi:hypothetical protein